MFSNDVHYLRLVVSDRQEQLRRAAGNSRLRRSRSRRYPDRPRVHKPG